MTQRQCYYYRLPHKIMWVKFFLKFSTKLESWHSLQKMPFYAVAKGRSVGIYQTWSECEAQVKGFSGARYKKFDTVTSAQDFVSAEHGGTSNASKSLKPKQHYSYNGNTASNTSSYGLKRSFSTSGGKQTYGNSSRPHSQNISQAWQASEQSDDDSDDLNTMLNKQMDDIEKRLKSFEKGVDRITKKVSKASERKAIMIEPPQPKRPRISNSNFEEDSAGYVQVYTDGACSANGRSGARAGIGVYWGDDHPLNVSEPVSGRATNNCGEIQAATRAMKQAVENGIKNITINTDSQFLINSVTKWMPGWKRKGWKLQSGEPVKNETDFKDLDNYQHKLNVRWNYVEAHRGVYGNEKADELAKAGASMYS